MSPSFPLPPHLLALSSPPTPTLTPGTPTHAFRPKEYSRMDGDRGLSDGGLYSHARRPSANLVLIETGLSPAGLFTNHRISYVLFKAMRQGPLRVCVRTDVCLQVCSWMNAFASHQNATRAQRLDVGVRSDHCPLLLCSL